MFSSWFVHKAEEEKDKLPTDNTPIQPKDAIVFSQTKNLSVVPNSRKQTAFTETPQNQARKSTHTVASYTKPKTSTKELLTYFIKHVPTPNAHNAKEVEIAQFSAQVEAAVTQYAYYMLGNTVPSSGVVYDEANRICGIYTRALPGFQPNTRDPIEHSDLVVKIVSNAEDNPLNKLTGIKDSLKTQLTEYKQFLAAKYISSGFFETMLQSARWNYNLYCNSSMTAPYIHDQINNFLSTQEAPSVAQLKKLEIEISSRYAHILNSQDANDIKEKTYITTVLKILREMIKITHPLAYIKALDEIKNQLLKHRQGTRFASKNMLSKLLQNLANILNECDKNPEGPITADNICTYDEAVHQSTTDSSKIILTKKFNQLFKDSGLSLELAKKILTKTSSKKQLLNIINAVKHIKENHSGLVNETLIKSSIFPLSFLRYDLSDETNKIKLQEKHLDEEITYKLSQVFLKIAQKLDPERAEIIKNTHPILNLIIFTFYYPILNENNIITLQDKTLTFKDLINYIYIENYAKGITWRQILEEMDLHSNNFGKEGHIDFDKILAPLLNELGLISAIDRSFRNCAPEDFEMTQLDIQRSPNVEAKGYHPWPTKTYTSKTNDTIAKFFTLNGFTNEDKQIFSELAYNPYYIYTKYKIILQFLILDDADRTIIFQNNINKEWSVKNINKFGGEEYLREKIDARIKERIEALRVLSFKMSEFENFINEYGDYACDSIISWMEQYKSILGKKITKGRTEYQELYNSIDTKSIQNNYNALKEAINLEDGNVCDIPDYESSSFETIIPGTPLNLSIASSTPSTSTSPVNSQVFSP